MSSTPSSNKGKYPSQPPPTPQQAAQQVASGLGVTTPKPIPLVRSSKPLPITVMVTAEETLFFGGNASRSTARTDDELVAETISCPKADRENLKSKDKKAYAKLKENSSMSLKDTKFELVKPFDTKIEATQLKEVTSVVTKVNKLKDRLRRDDMIDVFKIPSSFTQDTSGNWVPASGAKAIDILSDYQKLDIETVRRSTAWYQKFGQAYHTENASWSGTLILGSCSESLQLKILETVNKYSEAEKGGPTFFFIMMKLIIATSQVALRGLVNVLSKTRLNTFDGESVLDCATFFKAAVTLLRDNDLLPTDIMTITFEAFSSSSCQEFNDYVNGFKNAIKLGLKNYELEEILRELEADYTDKLGSGKWPAKDTKVNQESTFAIGTMCFNCGGLDHMLKDCPKPFDQSAIKARKQILLGNGKGSNSGGGKKNYNNNSNNKGNENKGNNYKKGGNNDTDESKKPKVTNPKKIPPKAGDSHEKSFDGKTLKWCGRCGRWGNHATPEHKTREELQNEKKDNNEKAHNVDEDESAHNVGGASCLNF